MGIVAKQSVKCFQLAALAVCSFAVADKEDLHYFASEKQTRHSLLVGDEVGVGFASRNFRLKLAPSRALRVPVEGYGAPLADVVLAPPFAKGNGSQVYNAVKHTEQERVRVERIRREHDARLMLRKFDHCRELGARLRL